MKKTEMKARSYTFMLFRVAWCLNYSKNAIITDLKDIAIVIFWLWRGKWKERPATWGDDGVPNICP